MRLPLPAAALALAVAGCLHGGDGPPMRSGAPEPDNAAAEEDRRRAWAAHPEFRNQHGLEQVKAHFAYARGATGRGVTLGIVDSGVDPAHPRFADKLETGHVGGRDPDFSTCGERGADGGCVDTAGHGTFVAGIMAANRSADAGAGDEGPPSSGSAPAIHGVAFDAEVISVGIPSLDEILEEIVEEFDLPENPTPEQFRALEEALLAIEPGLERQIAEAFEWLNGRVTAVNASFGLPGNIEDFDAAELRARFPNVIAAIAQKDTPAGERTVYVWAAGNAGGEPGPGGPADAAGSVEIAAGLPVRIPELRGHALAVMATDREGRIAAFSNRCGIARDFCLAAPGVDIAGPAPAAWCAPGGRGCFLAFGDAGTSSAAPFVTGGIGLLAEHFRGQLGNDEIVERILATADRTGDYADSGIYGRGFLDLDAATRPAGETRMLSGRSLSGAWAPSRTSAFRPGAAFGDSLVRGLGQREVASFDELDAPFFRPLRDHMVPDALAAPRLGDRLRALGRDPRGASWRTEDGEIRLRLDAAPPGIGAGAAPGPAAGRGPAGSGGPLPGAIGSLSLAREAGSGRFLFGWRSHPGWRFGLHAGPAADGGRGPVGPATFTDDGAFANPWLAFARDGASIGYAVDLAANGGLRIAAFRGSAPYGWRRDAGLGDAAGVLAEYRFAETLLPGLAVQAGWLAERRGLAGSRSRGAFGTLAGDTLVTGLSAHRRLDGRWRLLAAAHAGASAGEAAGDGMVRDVSPLLTGAFALGLIGEEAGRGRLAFRLSQPLRVEAGRAGLRWVSGRTADGRIVLERAAIDLEPSGRQIDLEAVWSRPWGGGEAHLAAIATRDAAHVRGKHDAMLLMRWRRAF